MGCLATLAIAGCGGSSSSSSSSSTSASSTPATTASSTAATSTGSATTGSATLGVATGSSAAYLKQLVQVVGPWQQAAIAFEGNFQRAVAAQNKQLVATTLDSFTSANETFASNLSKLTPPGNATGQQADLVKKVRQLGSDLKDAKAAFAQTNASALQSIDAKIKADTQALVQSAAALGQAVRSG